MDGWRGTNFFFFCHLRRIAWAFFFFFNTRGTRGLSAAIVKVRLFIAAPSRKLFALCVVVGSKVEFERRIQSRRNKLVARCLHFPPCFEMFLAGHRTKIGSVQRPPLTTLQLVSHSSQESLTKREETTAVYVRPGPPCFAAARVPRLVKRSRSVPLPERSSYRPFYASDVQNTSTARGGRGMSKVRKDYWQEKFRVVKCFHCSED